MTDAPPFLVDVDQSDGRVAVEVRAEGRRHSAVVERVHDLRLRPHIPIGTRERQHLRMMVDDLPVDLRPGPGRWSRHSYRVVAEHEGHQYVYRPRTSESSRLLRDGFRVGDFTVLHGGGVLAEWIGDPEPVDVAIGYALAAAFGAGAEFFLVAFLEHPAL
ncbi:hypothetical protein BJY16_003425 [Actinoplanes octamycinicus]|uniref:Uncharacterized protein n=1 Tax=Actinoplanes octamycinicus TaxID=135948 RepID=A0A7W7M7P9_9ACTN|nr:hypothetical protein [Actinoplanes octamycinicus]MBB4739966.1 hypothetical protein [Actinoplanes octamycinicus]GIE55151.1 hypothetical protein Aoc01nite_05530 [Actinoplanes octamycinicus]